MCVDNSVSMPKIEGLCDLLERNDYRARSLKSCQNGVPRVHISGEAHGMEKTEVVIMDIVYEDTAHLTR